MAIQFYFEKKYNLTDRKRLKSFIEQLFVQENMTLQSLNIVFMDDEQLRTINKKHLMHDYYTDVITFNLTSNQLNPIEGEVYISVDTVTKNAAEYNVSVSVEMLRVIFHGCLHLCGYQDKTKANQQLMKQKEDHYLAAYLK